MIGETLDSLVPSIDLVKCFVQQVPQVDGLKLELAEMSRNITTLVEERQDLAELEDYLIKALFSISL